MCVVRDSHTASSGQGCQVLVNWKMLNSVLKKGQFLDFVQTLTEYLINCQKLQDQLFKRGQICFIFGTGNPGIGHRMDTHQHDAFIHFSLPHDNDPSKRIARPGAFTAGHSSPVLKTSYFGPRAGHLRLFSTLTYTIENVIFFNFYEMNLTWVGYFNSFGPEWIHFNIDSGLKLTFLKPHCSSASPKCPALVGPNSLFTWAS